MKTLTPLAPADEAAYMYIVAFNNERKSAGHGLPQKRLWEPVHNAFLAGYAEGAAHARKEMEADTKK